MTITTAPDQPFTLNRPDSLDALNLTLLGTGVRVEATTPDAWIVHVEVPAGFSVASRPRLVPLERVATIEQARAEVLDLAEHTRLDFTRAYAELF